MEHKYELFEYHQNLPLHTSLHSVQAFPPHWHKELEILFVLRGSIYVMLQNVTHRISRGNLVVISPNKMHFTQQTEETNLVLALHINCEAYSLDGTQDINSDFQFNCLGDRQAHPQIAVIRKRICEMLLELLYKQPGYKQTVSAYTQTILGILQRYFAGDSQQKATLANGTGKHRMRKILQHINANYTQRITLKDVASQEYISLNYLSALFQKHLGMTFTDYLNTVRLKAYVDLMETNPNASLSEISERCGFSSPQYASKQFTTTYRMTPGKYRRELEKKESIRLHSLRSGKHQGYVKVFNPIDLNDVLEYWMKESDENNQKKVAAISGTDCTIDCTTSAVETYWRSALRIATIGRAYDGLLSHVQHCLRRIQNEIGFTHLRFHGILSDEMMILNSDISGGIRYSWRMVDMLIDFMLSIRLRPFLELTYMPSLLASGKETVFHWRGNITPPSSLSMWCALVEELVRHCLARYGEDEVAHWYFEVWNEPDYEGVSWTGTREDFFYFYERTAKAIRKVFPAATICGPSVSTLGIRSKKWISPFREYCLKTGSPLDALSIHAYPEIVSQENLLSSLCEATNEPIGTQLNCPLMGRDYLSDIISLVNNQMTAYRKLPLIVTEWNITMSAQNPINDSMFAATSLIRDALRIDDKNITLAHWNMCDYMEEQFPLPIPEFHGGFGLMTVNGLRKPTYWAMWALSKLQKDIVARLDNGIITKRNDHYTLVAFYHSNEDTAYDMKYSRPWVAESLHQDEMISFTWNLKGLKGSWRLKRFHYRGNDCDPRTLMQGANLHEPLSIEDVDYLDVRSQPIQRQETLNADEEGNLQISFRFRLFEFEVIDIFPAE